MRMSATTRHGRSARIPCRGRFARVGAASLGHGHPARVGRRHALCAMQVSFLRHRLLSIALLLLLPLVQTGTVLAADSEEIRVTAQVDTSQDVYAGDDFQYHIVIDGIREAGEVDTSPLAPWNPRSAGVQDHSRTMTQIINGRGSTEVIKRIVMTYLLHAENTGPIALPPVTVVIKGKTYRTNPVSLTVVQPGQTDQLDVEIALTPKECYVGQPVELAIRLYYTQDIRDSRFSIPILTDDAFVFENPDTVPSGAREAELAPGITMVITQQTTVHKGRRTNLLMLHKVLVPQKSGTFNIDPVVLSTDMAVGRARSNDPFDDFGFFGARAQYKRFQVRSEPTTLTVNPLPEQGKPDGFYGLIGDYQITAEASVTKVNVGDPITLTIKVGGGFLQSVQWPDLNSIPGFADNFKVPEQQASPVIENGYKAFTQTIRANNSSVTEIPAIELPCFSPGRGAYVVAKTNPIPLEVAETKVLTGADIEGRDSVTLSKEVEAIRQGLSANYEDPDCLVDRTFSPLAALFSPTYGVVWFAPFVALIVSAGVRIFGANSPEKQSAVRRRKARSATARKISAVMSASQPDRPAQMVEAMRSYIGDRFDKVSGSLTADDCCRIVTEACSDTLTAARYKDIMSQFEASRYAPSQSVVDEACVTEVLELIRQIDRKARK